MGREDEAIAFPEDDFETLTSEARKHVWMGAIPLLVHLHDSEVTTLPGPFPYLVLAPRNGYLPLLADSIKPHFQSSLPPGSDTIWFDYEGLPLKWHIPTGVLFDLLCAEPERPWNLTVHFRAYPSDVLSPCEDDDAVKWNFVNALKEASYVMYGSTKSIMNLSQLEQSELWKSVVKGDLDSYDHIFNRIRPGFNLNSSYPWNSRRPSSRDSDLERTSSRGGDGAWPGRLPVRFYIRSVKGKYDDLCDSSPVESWDQLVYMTRPIDVPKDKGLALTLRDALIRVVPHLFSSTPLPGNREDDELVRSPQDSAAMDPGRSGDALDIEIENDKLEAEGEGTEEVAPSPSSGDANISQPLEAGGPSEEVPAEEFRTDAEVSVRSGSGAQAGKSSRASTGGLWDSLDVESAKQFQGIVRIQGIELNLDIPLDWVARNLCGPEMFIHVCICTWVTQ